ncbi:MAG: hypothetical protein D6724_10455 [Armatimonadetes bacterium]|nr:MAG: hypothetical protein D6724_10455 [Armatimonadota bacterium]
MHVVCVNVGAKFPDTYVERMFHMCRRHLPGLQRFTCFTDRRRHLSPEVRQVDCSDWGLSGWWPKLRLFDRRVLDEPFLFLDLDQIVLRPLDRMVRFVDERPDAPVLGMQDFLYQTFSSSILYVRPSNETQVVWDSFACGERYEADGRSSGDQDFIEGCLRAKGLSDILSTFPSEWFVSYKVLRKETRGQTALARERIKNALFLVFHGRPMPHEVLQPWRSLLYLLQHKPLRAFQYWRFLEKEVRQFWCLEDAATDP